ncbi:hypothetical protein AC229_1915 [Oenococcus oeni]|nr:hypothetical protein AC229_1915 [Oenococcus oeni]
MLFKKTTAVLVKKNYPDRFFNHGASSDLRFFGNAGDDLS